MEINKIKGTPVNEIFMCDCGGKINQKRAIHFKLKLV